MTAPLIELRDVWQTRDSRDTLKNINLRIERGEIFALIGPTGAGKTTLLRIIDLLDAPSAGRVFIDGTDTLSSEKVRLEIRRRIGFVLQKPMVFNASVYENIAYGLKWRGLEKYQVRETMDEILGKYGLVSYKNRNARTLSGGEMQRVAIARAIAPGPEVLLLDEPSANLDPVSASTIEQLITSVIRKETVTVIMATHDMEQGQRLADRIGMLANGEIIQTGAPGDMFARPKNREVAEFVGMENIIDGVVVSNDGDLAKISINNHIIDALTEFGVGEEVSVCMRAEDITVALSPTSTSARNSLAGEVVWSVFTGPLCRIEIDCGFPLVVLVTRRSAEEMGLKKGAKVYANFKVVSIHVIKRH